MEATPIKKIAKRKPKVQPPAPTPSLKVYRRIAVTFFLVTLATLGVVIYLSFSRATIQITPEQKTVTTTFVADVVATPTKENEVTGKVVSNIFEQAIEQAIPDGGTGTLVEAKAGGTVTIYDTTTSPQVLVATTRLLTPSGVLFRLDKTVTVPADGSVQATVHADQVGATGDIAPTKFTIPGLSTALQTRIYAQSSAAFTGGVTTVKVVTQENLDAAAKDLQDQILTAAKDTLRLQAGGSYDGETFFVEPVEKKSDTVPGTQASSVNVSLKVRIVGVFFTKEDLLKIAEGKLFEQVTKGMELTNTNTDSLQLTVDHYDLDTQMANISVSLSGFATLSPTSTLLDKAQFVGKSSKEVKTALESSDAIKSVNITFTPFWLTRMPTLKDHITIVIK